MVEVVRMVERVAGELKGRAIRSKISTPTLRAQGGQQFRDARQKEP